MLEKLGLKITLIAALIVTIYGYFNNSDFLKTCYAIIITIVVFYFLGGFLELFLKKKFEEIKEEKTKAEETNLDDNEEYLNDNLEEQ